MNYVVSYLVVVLLIAIVASENDSRGAVEWCLVSEISGRLDHFSIMNFGMYLPSKNAMQF
jgi:hypothetical protein